MARAAISGALLVGGVNLMLACGSERWLIGALGEEGADAGLVLDASAAASCAPAAVEPMDVPAPNGAALEQLGRFGALPEGEEARVFPPGRLEIEIRAGAPSTLRFGVARPPVPPGDGSGGYLCGASGAASCSTPSGFVAGFDYALGGLRSRGSIVSFDVPLNQPWAPWCALQQPLEQRVPGCEPFHDIEPRYTGTRWGEACTVQRGEEWFEIDCERLATVEHRPCICSAESCRWDPAERVSVNLRLVSADLLEGAIWFAEDRALVVRLERQIDTP